MKKTFLFLSILTALLVFARVAFTVQAAPAGQGVQYFTPTPGPDGRIIYIVQTNDNCLRISLLTGMSLEELLVLNNLDQSCVLTEGQELLLGTGGPVSASPTSGPSPTPTPILPTPTAIFSGDTQVCVLLYNDLNGDALRQEKEDAEGTIPDGSEPAIADGAVSLTKSDGSYSQTQNTLAGLYPICFEQVPAGNYTVSVAIPDGYSPTTLLSNSFSLNPGDVAQLAFGAQESAFGSNSGGGTSGALGWIGGLMLFGGLGLGYYAMRSRETSAKTPFSRIR